MGTFKENLYAICREVADEFPGWSFTGGDFKNKSVKHTTQIVMLGFGFENGRTPLQPSVWIENRKTLKLYKYLLSYSVPTSILLFQVLANELTHMPEHLRIGAWINQDRQRFLDYVTSIGKAQHADDVLDITEAKPVLRAVLQDGIALIERHYDLSSEENFLKALPPKYTPRNQILYDEYEGQRGVMI